MRIICFRHSPPWVLPSCAAAQAPAINVACSPSRGVLPGMELCRQLIAFVVGPSDAVAEAGRQRRAAARRKSLPWSTPLQVRSVACSLMRGVVLVGYHTHSTLSMLRWLRTFTKCGRVGWVQDGYRKLQEAMASSSTRLQKVPDQTQEGIDGSEM